MEDERSEASKKAKAAMASDKSNAKSWKNRTTLLCNALALPLILLTAGNASAQVVMDGFPVPAIAPKGAPNVIVILTDDVGFGSGSTFGGLIPTPTMDNLAKAGLRYGNFHTNALCSPSRAALLTGRNAHAVGFGGVTDFATGSPGYNSVIPKSAGTIGHIFKENGYATAWFGKNHTVPSWQNGPMGPFDQWASGQGFDYFYGFHGGAADQFSPPLIENHSTLEPPKSSDYHLDKDLADRAIHWIKAQKAQATGQPFLIHYAPTTAHAPLHAPADWIAKFRGKFDAGWDVLQKDTFARQKKLSVIPKNATLAPLPSGVPAWSSLTTDQRKLYARYMEVYAAALSHADYQLGRVVKALRESGELDNTIIVYIQGDNGASPEGGQTGAINYAEVLNTGAHKPEDQSKEALARLDEIGGPSSYPAVPMEWAAAMNTPYPYFKAVSSRLGGLTNGMVISWPKGIKARGERQQFMHLVDVLPTLLEASGLKAPEAINGVTQTPFDGVSFVSSFARKDAPELRHTQYFEVNGQAAIYHDGWLAATPLRAEGNPLTAQWELYDLRTDSSQTVNVAARHPEKLKELRQLFDAEATRNQVYPIPGSSTQKLLPANRPEPMARAGRYVLAPSPFRYAESSFPSIKNRSWSVEAELEEPTSGGHGVLATEGGRFSGWGLTILNGVPTFLYRTADRETGLTRLAAPNRLSPGRHKVRVDFTVDGKGLGRGGLAQLSIDGSVVASTKLERTVGFKFAPEGASIGHDTGTTLVDDYSLPGTYNGALHTVTFDLQPTQTPDPKP